MAWIVTWITWIVAMMCVYDEYLTCINVYMWCDVQIFCLSKSSLIPRLRPLMENGSGQNRLSSALFRNLWAPIRFEQGQLFTWWIIDIALCAATLAIDSCSGMACIALGLVPKWVRSVDGAIATTINRLGYKATSHQENRPYPNTDCIKDLRMLWLLGVVSILCFLEHNIRSSLQILQTWFDCLPNIEMLQANSSDWSGHMQPSVMRTIVIHMCMSFVVRSESLRK